MSFRPRLRAAARAIGLRSALKRAARAAGFDLVKRSFYSPIPAWEELPETVWSQPGQLRGLNFEVDRQLAFLEQQLAVFFSEFTPPSQPPDTATYWYGNGFFGAVDADVLYAMVRKLQPGKIVELGSGYSSLVIGAACAASQATETSHDVYDPFARPELSAAIANVADLHLVSANDVALSVFETLEQDDILFVDTTHTVKLASDVNHIVLEVLPVLKPGVIVHFHDIFLPWEYPRAWLTDPEVFWAEQYLLQAFLAFNERFEVLLGNAAVLRADPERVRALVPSAPLASGASSLWIRRRD